MTAVQSELPAAEKTKIDLDAARRVLSVESDALGALARSLDGRFSKALDLIMKAEGRVIISGMGKSGLVGAKIAATLLRPVRLRSSCIRGKPAMAISAS